MFFIDNLSVSNAQKVKMIRGGEDVDIFGTDAFHSGSNSYGTVRKVEKLRMRVLFGSSGDGVDP